MPVGASTLRRCCSSWRCGRSCSWPGRGSSGGRGSASSGTFEVQGPRHLFLEIGNFRYDPVGRRGSFLADWLLRGGPVADRLQVRRGRKRRTTCSWDHRLPESWPRPRCDSLRSSLAVILSFNAVSPGWDSPGLTSAVRTVFFGLNRAFESFLAGFGSSGQRGARARTWSTMALVPAWQLRARSPAAACCGGCDRSTWRLVPEVSAPGIPQ